MKGSFRNNAYSHLYICQIGYLLFYFNLESHKQEIVNLLVCNLNEYQHLNPAPPACTTSETEPDCIPDDPEYIKSGSGSTYEGGSGSSSSQGGQGVQYSFRSGGTGTSTSRQIII